MKKILVNGAYSKRGRVSPSPVLPCPPYKHHKSNPASIFSDMTKHILNLSAEIVIIFNRGLLFQFLLRRQFARR
jgi:hypothetical protein